MTTYIFTVEQFNTFQNQVIDKLILIQDSLQPDKRYKILKEGGIDSMKELFELWSIVVKSNQDKEMDITPEESPE